MIGDGRWAVLLGLGGAMTGSFLATVAIRALAGDSALSGRSRCDGCGRTLRAIELVPVLSYLARRGRCGACGATIDARHPLFEVAAILLGALAGWVAGPAGMAGALFGWLLLTLAVIDASELWLPDPLVAALALCGAVSAWWLGPPPLDRLVGGVAGFGALWAIGAAYRRARGREGLGAGDPKLMGAIGLWLGWRPLPAVLLAAALIGLGVVLLARVAGRRVDAGVAVPFGTYLAAAAYPAWLAMVALAP